MIHCNRTQRHFYSYEVRLQWIILQRHLYSYEVRLQWIIPQRHFYSYSVRLQWIILQRHFYSYSQVRLNIAFQKNMCSLIILAITLSVLRSTVFDYTHGIFKLFNANALNGLFGLAYGV
jgi:hypothetical protein